MRAISEIIRALFERSIPDLYPKVALGCRPLKGGEAEDFLKQANLNSLPQVFYTGEQGLNLVAKEGNRFVPNPHAEVAQEILGYLKREHQYGNKVTGKQIAEHFSGLGYGWQQEVIQLVLAVLFRAGSIVVTHQGRPYRSYDSPTWSRDGNWVYFASNRTGRWEVWKVSAGGGEAIRVTRNGGETAFESPDGKSIYYTKELFRPSGLWRMPLSGGEESQVLPSVSWRAFFPVKDGIYFIPGPGADGKSSIQFLSFATAKVKIVTPMSSRQSEGLSVSPDGRSILFSQLDELGSDLMLVENFR